MREEAMTGWLTGWAAVLAAVALVILGLLIGVLLGMLTHAGSPLDQVRAGWVKLPDGTVVMCARTAGIAGGITCDWARRGE
jgi:hypothetical protein